MSVTLRFQADEDLDNDIIHGMLRRLPNLDIVRAQEVGLSGALNPVGLEWAAQEGRVLLTPDVSTITAHAYTGFQRCTHAGSLCSESAGPDQSSARSSLMTRGM